MNKAQLKELVKNIMMEESEYQVFFKKALEKAGKSIPSMSDEEKKAFFDKIDATWDGKGEKNEGNAFGAAVTAAKKAGEDEFEVGGETYKVEEELVGGQKKLDVDGDGEIESSDLADLRAGKKVDEAGVPAIIKGMSPKLLKVGEKITINTNGKKTEYKVVKYNSNGDCVLHPVNEGVNEASDLASLRAGKKADEAMELPKATIPSAVKSKLDMAIDKIKDSDLTYNQKVQVVGQVMDSLGIDKAEFNKMTSKLKGTIESVNEGSHGMATKLLQSIVSGDSSRAEGTKMSKELAQHYIDWIRTSPFGKKNGNLPLDMLVKASFNWGIERGLDPKLKGELSKLKSTIKESVNEAKYREAKDDWGVRLVQAIHNNVKALHTSVIREKKDVKQAVDVFGNVLKNAIKETLKHKYKPNPKAKDADDKIKTFISELKKFENIVDMVIAKPTKIGVTKLDDAWRSIWNHKYAAEIALAGNVFDSIIEGVSPKEMDAIKSAVQSASSFMGIGSELKKLGMKYTFATEPLPIYIIQPTPNNKVAIVNKKYASKPDFVHGDIAVGVMESKTGKSVNEGRAFINAARKAKTEGLTEFEFNGKKYPVTIKD